MDNSGRRCPGLGENQVLGCAGLRSSSQGGQASDDTQVFTHPQGFQLCAEQDRQGGARQPLLLVLSLWAPTTEGAGRRVGVGGRRGKLRLEAQPH